MGYYSGDYAKLDEDAIRLRADYGFFEYEIDVFELASYLGIRLMPYTSLTQEQRDFIASLIDFDDGFTVMRKANGEWSFYTYYNDELPVKRQRFIVTKNGGKLKNEKRIFSSTNKRRT